MPFYVTGFTPNVDESGYFNFHQTGSAVLAYVRVFDKSALVESVDAELLRVEDEYSTSVASVATERSLAEALDRYRRLLDALGAPFPLLAQLTLTGIKGRPLAVEARLRRFGGTGFTRDRITLPLLQIDETTTDVFQLARPALDKLWEAAGFLDGCLHFDESGRYAES
jgi:hypothetical protein